MHRIAEFSRWPAELAPGGPASPAGRSARLDRWVDIIGESAAALSPDTAAAILAAEARDAAPGHRDLPGWLLRLRRDLARAAVVPGGGVPDALPFAELARDLSCGALERIERKHPWVGPPAVAACSVSLMRRIGEVLGEALQFEFRRWRAARYPSGARELLRVLDPARDGDYREFVSGLRGLGLLKFFERFPVAARLVATVTQDFERHAGLLFQRLRRDAPLITLRLGVASPTSISQLRLDLSDRHDRGQSVAIVETTDGTRFVYKPRSLEVDRRWRELAEELAASGSPVPVRAPRVVSRRGYGWAEYIRWGPCGGEGEGREFYRRMGGLMCLLYLLGTSDCHHENLIAEGSFPVLVDLETLVQPERGSGEGPGGGVADSVLRTGLLPNWSRVAPGRVVDSSAIGAGAGAGRGNVLRFRWVDLNRDEMHVEQRATPIRTQSTPTLPDGQVVSAQAHATDIADGFALMFSHLRRFLESREGTRAVTRLGSARGRWVRRPTRLYSGLLRRLLMPDLLRDAVDWSIELSVLRGSTSEEFASLARFEEEAMRRLDVPCFGFRETSLIMGNGERPAFFALSPSGCIARRRGLLSDVELERQLGYLRGSLALTHLTSPHSIEGSREQSTAPPRGGPIPSLLDACVSIGAGIEMEAISVADGPGWIAPEYLDDVARYELRPVGTDFFSGSSGIALYLLALGRACADDRWSELGRQTIGPVARWMERAVASRAFAPATSFVHLSTAYAMAACGRVCHDDALVDVARRFAASLDPSPHPETPCDLLGGLAGCILCLDGIAGADSPALTERIAALGDQLARRGMPRRGRRVWTSRLGTALSGLSHGAAGVGLALWRAARRTSSDRLRALAIEALELEREQFDHRSRNWPDMRFGKGEFADAWCHGAAGIGLSRLAIWEDCEDPLVEREIRDSVAAAVRRGPEGPSHLCCGAAGRLELVHRAGRFLPGSSTAAHQQASALVASLVARGPGRVVSGPAGLRSPSFFQGSAGVGYTLLSLMDPALPCVAVFE